jgi:hypothetical protein
MTDITQADRDLVDKLLGVHFREKQSAIAATFDQVAAESRSQATVVMLDKTHSMVDITAPNIVEVQVRYDGRVVWVNVDGLCRLRACQIGNLAIHDSRINYNIFKAVAESLWAHGEDGEAVARDLAAALKHIVIMGKGADTKVMEEIDRLLQEDGSDS